MPVSAQAAGERLEQLEREHGKVTPKVVLEDARAEGSLLHPCFEWDDSAAAEKYRESQAGYLIRNLTITVEQEEKPPQKVRAYVSVTKDENRAFVNVCSALSEEETRAQVLAEALRALQSFREKYRGLSELSGVISEIDALTSA